jgi:hypothetical protein
VTKIKREAHAKKKGESYYSWETKPETLIKVPINHAEHFEVIRKVKNHHPEHCQPPQGI